MTFSVSTGGFVTLRITSGTITSSTYRNGARLNNGVTSSTTWSNSVSVRVPSGYSNSGSIISRIVTAVQSPTAAVASWICIGGGSTTGGTLSHRTYGRYGEWTGASNIMYDTSGNPSSATCNPSSATCFIRRERSVTAFYTGGSRSVSCQCVETRRGSGTPTCAPDSSRGLPSGTLGQTQSSTQGGQTYSVQENPTVTNQGQQIRGVPNDAYMSLTELTSDNIGVTACSVSASGANPVVITNIGTATVRSRILPNNLGSARRVTLIFDVTINTVPTGFFSDETPPIIFRALRTTCIQPAIAISTPEFTPNSARVNGIHYPDGATVSCLLYTSPSPRD